MIRTTYCKILRYSQGRTLQCS